MEKLNTKYNKQLPAGVRTVDVYRLLHLFEVTDPCIQHAIKKLLMPGLRGDKTVEQDVNEAIQSLNRYQQMRKEESTIPKGKVNIDMNIAHNALHRG